MQIILEIVFSKDTHQPYTVKIGDTIFKNGIYKIIRIMKLEIVCDEFHVSHEGVKETNEQTFEILLLKASCLSLLPISFIIPGLLTLGHF